MKENWIILVDETLRILIGMLDKIKVEWVLFLQKNSITVTTKMRFLIY